MMKRFLYFVAGLIAVAAAFWVLSIVHAGAQSGGEASFTGTPVPYGNGQIIAKAIKAAAAEGKYALVQSSAQGCGWCHILAGLMTTNPEIVAKIKSNFVYVIVDTTNDQNRDFYQKYADGTDHTLVLAVFDGRGKELTRDIGFDIVTPDPAHPGEYQITPEHVLAFLDKWSPKKAAAILLP
jgi:thioredoxin-related protein